jgi:hypothetical protein
MCDFPRESSCRSERILDLSHVNLMLLLRTFWSFKKFKLATTLERLLALPQTDKSVTYKVGELLQSP